MLTQIRNASKGWLATILVGLLVLAFGTWGIQGVFLPSPTDAVAKVGDKKIQSQEFILEFVNTLNAQSRQTGERMSPQEASRMGLDKLYLEQMITRTAYDVMVDKLGLTVPDDVLSEIITSNEAFQGMTGEFDRQRYRELLSSMRLSETRYENAVREDMARIQLTKAISGGIKLPRGMIEAVYKYNAEQRRARYLILKPELAGKIPEPDEEALARFHQTHDSRYTAPQARAFTYVLLRPKDVIEQIDIPEDDVAREYQVHKQEYVKPETRKVRQITYSSRDEALAALQKINRGAAFETIAEEKGLKPEDIDLGDLRKEEFLDAAVAEAAFALETPGMTGVIEGQFGFVIAEVVSITPSTTKSLEEVREELRERIALDTATGRVEDIRRDFEDALAAQSASLEDIAEGLGLEAVKVPAVDETGSTPDGERPETLPEESDVLRAAFVNEEGEGLGLERLSTDGYFVVRIDKVRPSALRPLDEIRERVAADWKDEQVRQRLEKLAGKLTARVNEGEKLSDIAGEFDLSVLTTRPPVRRDGIGTDVFSEQVLKELFSAAPGEVVSGQVRNGESYLVATLTDILPPNTSSPQARAALNERMQRFDDEYGLTLADQYARHLREDLGVKRYEDALAQAISEAR
ncbi:MAG: SurA N-terminal domain-containing protein [Alphaproteobacteria bacterium]